METVDKETDRRNAGFDRRKDEYEAISRVKWIYDLNIPFLNFHVSRCIEKKMKYEEIIECLLSMLAAEHKVMNHILLERIQDRLII